MEWVSHFDQDESVNAWPPDLNLTLLLTVGVRIVKTWRDRLLLAWKCQIQNPMIVYRQNRRIHWAYWIQTRPGLGCVFLKKP